jgi:hypothetical protein
MNVIIVSNEDDWSGLYVDGKIKLQGHHLRADEVLEVLGINVLTISCNHDWLNDMRRLPENFDEVEFDE